MESNSSTFDVHDRHAYPLEFQISNVERVVRLSREIEETLLRIKEEESGPDAKLQANRLQEKILTADDLQAAKDMIKILRLPYIFTTRVESSKVPAISQMYPWIWDMTHGQDPFPDSTNDACQRMHSVILKQVRRRWPLENIPDAVIIATYLNPAAKHHELFNVRVTRGGHNELLKTHAESRIVQKLFDLIKIKGLPIDPQDDAGNSSDDEPENARLAQTGGCPISRWITSELLLYIGHAFRHPARKEKYFDDPLAWWSKHSSTYSYLSFLVRQYLSIQASSVPSERLFSASGNLVIKKRTSLEETTIENLLFIRHYVHPTLEDQEVDE